MDLEDYVYNIHLGEGFFFINKPGKTKVIRTWLYFKSIKKLHILYNPVLSSSTF